MSSFNSYVVYDKEGFLLAEDRSPGEGVPTMPGPYFDSLPAGIKQCADVMLVLQEGGVIARYRVHQPTMPTPTLGPRTTFRGGN